ncbi:MAG: substrate-binding domain-containing protein, partial [Nitrospinota bacterium]
MRGLRMLLRHKLLQWAGAAGGALVVLWLLWGLMPSPPGAGLGASLRLATTTSTVATGLLEALAPPFERRHRARVDVISVGTGRALKLGERGDVDLLLVHAPGAEARFVEQGHGVGRTTFMENDFLLLGPPADPAGIRGTNDAARALKKVAEGKAPFVSRGDDSGTHKREKLLWAKAGLPPRGAWYLEAGQGMAGTLRVADEKRAYTLSDLGTYFAYRKRLSLIPLVEGDPLLRNPYSAIAVNPSRHPSVNHRLAFAFIAWLVSPQAQRLIRDYRRGGEQLFRP